MKNKLAVLLAAIMTVFTAFAPGVMTSFAADTDGNMIVTQTEDVSDSSDTGSSTSASGSTTAADTQKVAEPDTQNQAQKSDVTNDASSSQPTVADTEDNSNSAIESKEDTENTDTAISDVAANALRNGWSTNKKSYYLNGEIVKGFLTVYEDGTAEKGVKIADNSESYYFDTNGILVSDVYESDTDGSEYYFDTDGKMVRSTWTKGAGTKYAGEDGKIVKNAWQEIEGNQYYFDASGDTAKNRWIGNYYVDDSGVMATSRWIGKYYVGSDGKWIPDRWVQNSTGWWYRYGDGTYPKNEWKKIGSSWYYFNNSGYMAVGWKKISGKWYYFNTSGSMATGWKKVSGKYYYLNSDGSMATGWKKISGKWYYLNSDGSMATGWKKVSGKYYYLNSDGSMATGWKKVGEKWYYLNSSGSMLTGWLKLNNKWYYFGSDGHAYKSWSHINGKLYYFDTSGYYMLSSTTRTIDGIKYTFNSDGTVKDGLQGYTSSTNYLVVIKKNSKKVTVYKKQNGQWTTVRGPMTCSVGAIKNGKSLTPSGTGHIVYKRYKMNFAQTTGFYVSWTNRGMGLHTVLYRKGSSSPSSSNLVDGRLGINISKGCVRLSVSNSKWVYDNVPVNTTIELENK